RYCAHEDSPVVFAITYKNDCDEEGFKELIGSKTKIRELLEHHQKIKEKKIILDNIDRINPSNWGGHLFWDDILKVVKDALALSANPHSEKEEEIYLRYFESLIEDLYYGYDENIPGLEMIENIDNEKGTTNGFRRYILDQFGEYFFKSNACERLKKKIDNLDELYDIKIDKETKGQTGWNSNDVNGTKSFHLLIKPKVNLDIFNGGRPKVGVPYSSIQIWFCIKNSKYIHEKNNDGELITKFVAHRLDIQFALNVYQIVNEDIKEWKKKIKNNPEIKKGRMHEGEFKKIKNDSGIEEPRIKKLDIVVPVESESMTIGEISAVYPADDWRESVLLFLKKTLLDWENKGHFKKLIEWWGDDLLTDDKINTNK
ncbi:MAG: hypothetical protein WCR55_13040, partial [Lentisphaerota bacterium]